MITIPGLTITGRINNNAGSVVYRGHDKNSNAPLIIKVYNNEHPSQTDINKIKREYSIAEDLNDEGIVRPVNLIPFQNSFVLVLEDFGGTALSTIMAEHRIELMSCMELYLKLAVSIGKMHQQGIIHKDIKPANIILNEKTGEVRLTDFSIASHISGERQAIVNPDLLEGTLSYISPEQTGRMNRSIDHRADLYSFGVVMYEMLTGTLPFRSTDAMELIHSHMAVPPIPPNDHDRKIPVPLSDIVMMLLAKNAEDRYHSAFGLRHDLEECIRQFKDSGNIDTFTLRSRDIPTILQIPEKLYGRETELDKLMNAFSEVVRGESQIILVKGAPGIGKSVLINEFHKPVIEHKGYFISGKFDQFKRDVPYSALRHAFQDLSHQILSEQTKKVNLLRNKIRGAVGHNGQIIIDLIPEMELIIGKQPPVEPLPPAQSQNRFNMVLIEFVKIFARKEHPLVLFLDDMQWADMATLKLVGLLASTPGIDSLLLIGALRDQEVNASHPLVPTLEEIHKAGTTVTELVLTPLSVTGTVKLITDTLACNKPDAETLAKLVMAKTYGNPFFINQFLRSLYQNEMIFFSTESYSWQLDIESIRTADITENVVEFMCNKIKQLSASAQKTLTAAACIGNKFDLDLLAQVIRSTIADTAGSLEESQKDGLLVPIGDSYKYIEIPSQKGPAKTVSNTTKVQYVFLHDRIQQAAYSLISDEQKEDTHYLIGKTILEQTTDDQKEDNLFEIVQHLNMGSDRILPGSEQNSLAGLNLKASQKAKATNAYDTAFQFAGKGIRLLVEDSWSSDYELTRDLSFEAAECAYLVGNTIEAEDVLKSVLEHVRTNEEKAQVYNLKTIIYAISGDYKKSVRAGLSGLRLLNIPTPENPGQLQVYIEFVKSFIKLRGRKPEELLALPRMSDRKQQLVIQIIMNTISTAYLINQSLFELLCLRGFYLTLQYGVTESSPYMMDTYAFALADKFMAYRSAYDFGKISFTLNQKFPSNSMKSKITAIFSFFYSHWRKPMQEGIEMVKKGFSLSVEAGDIVFAGYSSCTLFLYLLSRGMPFNELVELTQPYIQVITTANDRFGIDFHLQSNQFILNLKGLTDSNLSFSDKSHDEQQVLSSLRKLDNANLLYHYAYFKTISLYLAGDYSGAVRINNKFARYAHGVALLPSTADACFYYSLSLTALYPEMTSAEKLKSRAIMIKNRIIMKKWANNCPDNFLSKYLLFSAEIAMIDGRRKKAFNLYSQAISTANKFGFIQVEAIANELMARYHFSCDSSPIALMFIRESCTLYEKWGAVSKAKALSEKYGIQYRSAHNASIPDNGALSTTSSTRHIDLTAVMRASQAISEEIVLSNLLQDIMKIAMQNAGASKGFLILERDGRLFIVVRGHTDIEDVEVMNSIPVETSPDLSPGIINYVQRTKETVVLQNASEEGLFVSEPYVVRNQSNSILCIPVLKQKKLTGILYLENDFLTNAFTEDRLEVLTMMAAQAAISIENAKLYEDVEQRVVQMQEADKKIRASLKEKEVLLREIHHRVKNNMQIISSMLNLQSSQMSDKKNIGILKDSQNRIKSMSLVHEKLYGSKDLASVNFSEYINDLAKGIFRSYSASANMTRLNIDSKDTWLGIDTAIPCGLIINELVSNALKHAFPDNREGEIKIIFTKIENDEFELTISDNGIGMPEGLDFRNTESLGLQLVTALSESQLEGKIKLNTANGTMFSLRFKEIEYVERI